ncbi:ParB/RepB/Spo0J family partition protein [Salmonella enterica]|nr:ParB/RepB/Spo0J family partition protein [Salmonella enterica]EHG2632959.1 ParB/RepB/Spo0J family partition protein [Salmonella enterica]EKM3930164.1 ParB/RepB/Spo0J family partition protein [Salmonella enterica]
MQPETFPHQIVMISIDQIKVINPRPRNKFIHDGIKESINKRGLSKPVTVRRIEDPIYSYALVCGQGRIEAILGLGESLVPAIIRDISEEDAYIMSLAENIVRRKPRSNELLEVVRTMNKKGLTDSEIAEILGYSGSWVSYIRKLLEKGEHKLLSAADRGEIPLYLAVEFSKCNNEDSQRLLVDAYENKLIKTKDIQKIRGILNQRQEGRKGNSTLAYSQRKDSKRMTTDELMKMYKDTIHEYRSILEHSDFIKEKLTIINEIFTKLLQHDSFIKLASEEKLAEIPNHILIAINGDNKND